MNQRSRNRRRHAAMSLSQLVERCNRIRVAQHNGNLASLLAKRSLTLGAGLGLGHGSSLRMRGVKAANGSRATLRNFTARPARKRLVADAHKEGSVYFGGNGNRRADGELFSEFLAEHGHLQIGSIPPMCESYIVTSDVSTALIEVAA